MQLSPEAITIGVLLQGVYFFVAVGLLEYSINSEERLDRAVVPAFFVSLIVLALAVFLLPATFAVPGATHTFLADIVVDFLFNPNHSWMPAFLVGTGGIGLMAVKGKDSFAGTVTLLAVAAVAILMTYDFWQLYQGVSISVSLP